MNNEGSITMSETITLNEQQMNLLREYQKNDVEFQAAKVAMDGTDFMSKDFDRAANEFSRTNHNRINAASVFAASVLAAFGSEVANG